jgi:hypothetical protein
MFRPFFYCININLGDVSNGVILSASDCKSLSTYCMLKLAD